MKLAPLLLDLPNLVTLSGLGVGLAAVGSVVRNEVGQGLLLALLAVLIDHLDGFLARRQTARSETLRIFGAHLDCYADFVSKGVFPALLLLHVADFAPLYWPIATLYLVAIAIRYSQEFVSDAGPSGFSPDYGIPILTLYFLGQPQLGDAYAAVLAGTLVALAGLSVAPTRIPKLEGTARAVFVAVLAGLMATLLSGM